jgi:hypothetical protein
MSDSYVEVLKNVSNLLAGYPTEGKLFGSTQHFIFVLGFSQEFQQHLYDFLVQKAGESDIAPNRMLTPSKLNGDNVTFIFNSVLPSSSFSITAEKLADAIYLTKVILKEPITAKVLCGDDKTYKCPTDLQCNNCVGVMGCETNSNGSCFNNNATKILDQRKLFFELLNQKLKFETIDSETFQWKVLEQNEKVIMGIFNEFNRDVSEFAKKVCDYIAPNHSYENTNIIRQNETYVRFQATNLFRFTKKEDVKSGVITPVDYLYIPDNLEEVLQQLNLSVAELTGSFQEITGKIQMIHVFNYFRNQSALRQQLKQYLEVWHSNIQKVHVLVHNGAKAERFINIYRRLKIFQNTINYDSDIFKKIVANRYEDIDANLIRSIVDLHANNFSQSLAKLYPWVDTNVQNLQQDTKISEFFGNLRKKVDKHFDKSNAEMIGLWFALHPQRVPDDWLARLVGFGRPDQYWLLPEYEIRELENTILDKNITLREYINILDFYLRYSFEDFIKYFHYDGVEKIDRLMHSDNFSVFFQQWNILFTPDAVIPPSFLEVLQTKYDQSFRHVSFGAVLPIFRNSVKRAFLFTQENSFAKHQKLSHERLDFIWKQLKNHSSFLFEEFKNNSMNRVIQNIIQLESSKLDSVLDRLSNLLIDELKLQNADFGLWQNSQPYQKMINLKYSMKSYKDFLRETETIFKSNDLEIPEEELEYLEFMSSRFEHLQKQAELSSFENGINTRWNWGRGFVKDEWNIKSNGAVLRSTINVGVKSVQSAIQEASFGSFDGSFFIFLFYLVSFLFRGVFDFVKGIF